AAAMEALDRTVAKLGDQQESAGDKMARAWTRVQNLIDNFVTSPAFGNLLTGLMDLAEKVLSFIEDMEPAINAVVTGVTKFVDMASKVFDALTAAYKALPVELRNLLEGKELPTWIMDALLPGTFGTGIAGLVPVVAGKMGGGALGQAQQMQDIAWDIARATDATVQKTDEWQK
ncbi:MAG TPA: hypothetical protein VMV78_10025, partial [Thiobacillus sp.]|nr:hypothetical protein [Thiobacillus sp.]